MTEQGKGGKVGFLCNQLPSLSVRVRWSDKIRLVLPEDSQLDRNSKARGGGVDKHTCFLWRWGVHRKKGLQIKTM